MKKIILFLQFLVTSIILCAAKTTSLNPNIYINGSNFSIKDLIKGNQIFFNRDNMFFGDIPEDYLGWNYLETNANSTYLPGPLPSFKLKADSDGYFYAMVADVEKPEVCSKWASDNGWELISGVISFGTANTAKLHFYRKACVKDEWVNIVQPETFSGVIIIAPKITEDDGTSKIIAASVKITSVGWMDTTSLDNGTIAYANRTYTYNSVKSGLMGLNITRYNGGNPPKLKIQVIEDGDMYIAQSNEDSSYNALANGWAKVSGYEFKYNDSKGTTFTLYKKTVKKDDLMEIISTAWQGVLVLSSKSIIFTNVIPAFLPPPGVVVHNSKATTLKFIGSPSITVLKDGTYLASHDYFGSFISNAFVYKSTDKGETWIRTAEIDSLNWAKLFTRNDELYLIGVEPKGTLGYGNVVIMRSYDGGYTWTKPIDKKHGLLLDGFYTCAPTPVVFHKGRIWKAMEDQGKVDGWGPFGALMMSIDDKADLLNADNWTISNELQYTAGSVNAWTWLEGNAVIAKDGSIVDVLRLHYDNDDEAGVIQVSSDGKTITYNAQTGISHIPGACKKFTINYDSISGRYWTLTNYVLPSDRGGNLERTRNTLALCWSTDLVNWTIKDVLLHTDSIATRGFQYADWLFDGNDVIAVVRTAWPDDTGNANSQHNANYLTFHRFRNFRYDKVSSDTSVLVKPWYKGEQSAIALTFDNGFKSQYDYAFPILQKYGIKSTFFVNSGILSNNEKTAINNYVSWSDLKQMADSGYEIGSNAVNNYNLTKCDYDVLLDQLSNDKDSIEKNVGEQCLTHSYPFGFHNDTVNVATSLNYISGIDYGGIDNPSNISGMEWYNIHSDTLSWLYPRSLDNEEISFDNFKSNFESKILAKGDFGVVSIHQIYPLNYLSELGLNGASTTEWLQKVCNYLSNKRSLGEIWPTTFSNIVRYSQERDNLRFKIDGEDTDTLIYHFTTWLDSSIFNFPLTIRITPPSTWINASCQIIENGNVIKEKTYDLSKEDITLDVIPDQQEVKLYNVSTNTQIKKQIIKNVSSYPCPATDKVMIQFDKPVEGTYKIFNNIGQCVLSHDAVTSANNCLIVPIEMLPSGLYIFKMYGLNNNYFTRIIKQ